MDESVRESLLFDRYGGLLTEKQRGVMRLYHEENLSLSEIAEEYGISRAAVHDALKKAENKLAEYESALGLVENADDALEITGKIRSRVAALLEDKKLGSGLAGELAEIGRLAAELEEKL
ncbi:MAG: helix-turn-helix domain-containing protein [Eubacterium sp.]|nr:helix-turn-helix domain-containing protein [Eubacterium sp.]